MTNVSWLGACYFFHLDDVVVARPIKSSRTHNNSTPRSARSSSTPRSVCHRRLLSSSMGDLCYVSLYDNPSIAM
uniref:Uncharacterized protein n=1 Tax=Aegilops tauschii subsp. strangulata TaxID=200361 RepID=A0A453HB60_AEGTS